MLGAPAATIAVVRPTLQQILASGDAQQGPFPLLILHEDRVQKPEQIPDLVKVELAEAEPTAGSRKSRTDAHGHTPCP